MYKAETLTPARPCGPIKAGFKRQSITKTEADTSLMRGKTSRKPEILSSDTQSEDTETRRDRAADK